MSTPVRLPRRARGRKLQAFSDPVHDHLMSMIVSLTAELSVARERQDTLERLLERHGIVQRAEIEAYRADEKVEAERTALRTGSAQVQRGAERKHATEQEHAEPFKRLF